MSRLGLLLSIVATALAISLPAGAGAAVGARAHRSTRCAHSVRSRTAHVAVPLSFRHARCPGHARHGHGGWGSHGTWHRRWHGPAVREGTVPDAHGRCANADLAPSRSDIERARIATLCLINRERLARHERALRWNRRLTSAAQRHSESMAFGGYFQHDGAGGETPVARMRATGYISSNHVGFEVGENIAWGSGRLGTPRSIVAAWMSSAGHRANILDPRFRDSGVGISAHLPGAFAAGEPGGVYTQDFGVLGG